MATTSKSQVTTLDDNAPEAAAPVPARDVGIAGSGGDVSGERKTITIHPSSEEGGNAAVSVAVNGVAYQIPRGVPCRVPVEVIHVLENAVETIHSRTPSGIVTRDVPRFAFSVQG